MDVSSRNETRYVVVLKPSRDAFCRSVPKSERSCQETPCAAGDSPRSMLFLSVLQAREPLTKTLCPSPRALRADLGVDEASFLLLGSEVLSLTAASLFTTC